MLLSSFDTTAYNYIDSHTYYSCINASKWNKAAGEDGNPREFCKSSGAFQVPYLRYLFNTVLDLGLFPKVWSTAMIVPLFRSGKLSEQSNDRGIFLTSIFRKSFSFMGGTN